MAFSDTKQKCRSFFHTGRTAISKSHKAPGIEDFEVLKPISRGAFGQVYLCRKRGARKLLAMKVMKKADVRNKNMVDQVVAERDALAISSRSPFVVQLFYSFQSTEKIFLVMEYMIGGDLKSLLHNYGFFDEQMAKAYVAEVTLALEYIHRHNIIHRDIKPDNMLVSDSGHVKLTDFGLTKLTSDRKPGFLDLINTPYDLSNTAVKNGSQVFWRTPGQLLSLTTQFTFSVPKVKIERNAIRHPTELGVLFSASSDCRPEYIFSPPDGACSEASESSFKSTPRGVKRPYCSFAESDVLDSSIGGPHLNTGLTRDIQEVVISGQTKKARSKDFGIGDDVKDWRVAERVRVWSQSLSSEAEMGQDPSISTRNMLRSPIVTFSDSVVTGSPGHVEICFAEQERRSDVLSVPSSYLADQTKTSPAGGCNGNNISGITALSETSHMSSSPGILSKLSNSGVMPAYDSPFIALPPTSDECTENDALVLSSPAVLECGPASSSCYYSASTSPSCDEVPARALPVCMFTTPVQMLRFISSNSSDENDTPPVMCVSKDESFSSSVNVDDSSCALFRKQTSDTLELCGAYECASSKTPLKTPYRTPKSCSRHPKRTSSCRPVFGTPDYLAPEILLNREHNKAVDWWALGVCLYEFLTGLPPFNDESVELVFDHILNRHLLWPDGDESLSCEAVGAVEQILTLDPAQRPGANEIRNMEFFRGINWKDLHNSDAPFVPQPDDGCDTTYFEAKNAANGLRMSVFKP